VGGSTSRLSVVILTLGIAVRANPAAIPAPIRDVTSDGNTTISDVQAEINQALGNSPATNDLNNDKTVTVVDVQIVIDAVLNLGGSTGSPASITGFSPASGPAGTLVTITGSNFGTSPVVSLPGPAGSAISLPLSSMTATTLVVVVPSGAVSGPVGISNGNATAFTASPFTVTPQSTFSLSVLPASASLIQGQSVSYSVQATSSNNFDQLAQLSVTGVPAGVTASFSPTYLAAGATSVLTLAAPANQPVANVNLSITASATVQNLPVTQSANVALAVVAPTTTLLGRTVVADAQETPLAGVTIATRGLDGSGNSTGCTNMVTTSDAAGNFAFTNLPLACTGPQLINFNGGTATSPPGKYDGVNLVFTLNSGQVTASPVLVHLPRIDTAEVFNVQQNASSDQTHVFSSIPGLSVTVYAGTTLTLPDGSQPNPFPISVVQVLPDRLPDQKPVVPTMIGVFYLSFQPNGTHASQPVAVTYPNTLNTPPGTDMPLMVLDANHGAFLPVGTGQVNPNGTAIVPDEDPAHPGHRYGITNFDW